MEPDFVCYLRPSQHCRADVHRLALVPRNRSKTHEPRRPRSQAIIFHGIDILSREVLNYS